MGGRFSAWPLETPPNLPFEGKIKFNGQYALGVLRKKSQGAPDVERYNGTFELLANLDAQTLTGSNLDLSVEAGISGSNFDGSVEFRGMSGALAGKLSSEYAQGVFKDNPTKRSLPVVLKPIAKEMNNQC